MEEAEPVARSYPRRRSEEWWQSTISEISSSKERVSEACARHGISECRYYYWRRKLGLSETKQRAGSSSQTFTPLTLPVLSSEVSIELTSGTRVVVRGGVDQQSLRTVLVCLAEVAR